MLMDTDFELEFRIVVFCQLKNYYLHTGFCILKVYIYEKHGDLKCICTENIGNPNPCLK